ncbi:hypothetical protein KR059_005925, partial [Drosophila kikkawai]
GTDPGAIVSRLETVYGNLHASSPRDVKTLNTSQNKRGPWSHRGLDNNNNICSLPKPELPGQVEEQQTEQQEQKIKYELPSGYQGTKICSCLRPPRAYECGVCHHYFQGRLSQICEKHPSDVFLMDLRECPYCMAQLEMIKESPISWENIRKFEDAPLPSDSDI